MSSLLATIKHNVWQCLVSWDQALTTTTLTILRFWEKAWADEPLSCRAHRCRLEGKPKLAAFIDTLMALFGDDDHCRKSFENEKLRKQLPPEARS